MTSSRRTVQGLAVTLLVAGAAAPFLPRWAGFLVIIAIAKALVALGLLLLMRTGLVSFGQGLYFAIGAYSAGVGADTLKITDAAPMVLLGALAAGLVALVLGLLLARYRTIFFAMLSLAFSMILYGLLVKSSALGSTDGFNVAARTVFGLDVTSPVGRFGLYGLAALVAFLGAVGVDRYLRTHLGRLAPAIRDNELRVEYMGASVRHVVHLHLVIAAVLAGAGGALTALAVGHVDPETAYWTTSGEFVFVAILSGTSSVAAPFAGALVLELLRSFAYEHAPNTWQLVMGGVMLAVILFLPEGLWSVFRRLRRASP